MDTLDSPLKEINEDIYTLEDYLPNIYNDKTEYEYINTLFKALELSYANALYQFAYIQLHMIFMVCIYYMLLKINFLMPNDIHNALHYMIKNKDRFKAFYGSRNTRDDRLYFGSFARLGESDVFLLLKIAGIDPILLEKLTKLVEERNKYTHANGNILITNQETIDQKIAKYLDALDKVQSLLKPLISTLYDQTLNDPDFFDIEADRAYPDDYEQITEELIKKYSLSLEDLKDCEKYDIDELSEKNGYESIKKLHIVLCNYYKNISNEEDTEPCVESS